MVEIATRGAARAGAAHRALPAARPLPGGGARPVDPVRRDDCRRPRSRARARARRASGCARCSLVDRYAGSQLPPGRSASRVSLRFQDRGAHAHERRGPGGRRRRRPGAARGGARDPGRVREETVEDSFKVLEERVQRAAERLKELAAETKRCAPRPRARTSAPSAPSASSRRSKERAASSARRGGEGRGARARGEDAARRARGDRGAGREARGPARAAYNPADGGQGQPGPGRDLRPDLLGEGRGRPGLRRRSSRPSWTRR